jgi:hypothetical protein
MCRSRRDVSDLTRYAHFSDRGRLFQFDRSRRFSVIVADHGTRE